MKKDAIIIFILLAVLAGIVLKIIQKNRAFSSQTTQTQLASQSTSTSQLKSEGPMTQKQYAQAPAMQLDAAKKYQAVLKTSKGEITIELDSQNTPVTANNFVFLAREGFYSGTVFHRIIEGFMIQGGDPTGTGSGGPGYRFADESISGEYERGTVAMANAGPNTNGSQFFIMHQTNPLPKNYVIFGHVVSGLETLDAIAESPVTYNTTGELSQPVEPITLVSVEIFEK
jgi:cyclophilin family peptidyl-prolyl cis-trans isomerase